MKRKELFEEMKVDFGPENLDFKNYEKVLGNFNSQKEDLEKVKNVLFPNAVQKKVYKSYNQTSTIQVTTNGTITIWIPESLILDGETKASEIPADEALRRANQFLEQLIQSTEDFKEFAEEEV